MAKLDDERTPSLRVLQVITDDSRRGAQTFALDLHDALAEQGLDVSTVALASEATDGLGVEVLGPSRRHLGTVVALRRRARSADVVIAHGSTTLTMAVIATTFTGTPVIYRQISDSLFWASSWSRRVRVAALLRRTRLVVALAEQSKSVLVRHFRFPADRIRVIPNGAPSARFPPPSDEQRAAARRAFDVADRFCVAYIGALVPEKGVDVAIEAVAGLRNTALLIAGDGPERGALERQARSVDADARFLGPVDRPLEVLHAADVVVLPSKGGDSMPAVLIEAGFVGLPVMSTTVGAIPEVIDDGVTGFLLDEAAPAPFRERLLALGNSPELRSRMGAAGRTHGLRKFDIGPIGRSWRDACTAVLR